MSDARGLCRMPSVPRSNATMEVVVQRSGSGGSVTLPPPKSMDYAAGFAAGRDAAAAASQSKIKALEEANQLLSRQVPAAFQAYMTEMEQQMREELVDLAFALTAQLTRQAVAPDALIRGAMEEILPQVLNSQELRVLVAPACCTTLQGLGLTNAPAGLRLVAAPHLQPGDVLVETENQGVFEGTLATRLANLRQVVGERLTALKPVPGNE